MRIAYTKAPGRGDTDRLLAGTAEALLARGFRVRGVVQSNLACEPDGPCDMDVTVLPAGPVLRISQSLGAGSRGCRLDPQTLETAVGLVEASLGHDTDLLIVNKFGKQEADGRGFRPVIAAAFLRDIPVLVGLNRLNSDHFIEFSGGTAEELRPDRPALLSWARDALGPQRDAG